MKAIVLTYAPVNEADKKLLQNTDIYKIATNFSAVELKPDIRLTADDIVDKCLECDTCDVVSINYDFDKPRVINACTMPKRHSSLLSCIDYLYFQGYFDILLIATNPPNTATYKINYNGINNLKSCLNLCKYTKDGNFDIPYKSIKDFIMLTDEEKIFGIEETPEKKYFTKTIFTDACEYEVSTVGKNNVSVESGLLVANLLPFEEKQKLINGANEVVYNDIKIKRITTLKPVEESKEPTNEIKEDKPKTVKKTVRKTAIRKKARSK